MLQAVPCQQCRQVGHGLDATTAHLTLTRHRHCQTCRHSHDRQQGYSFCSPACLVEFVLANQQQIREAQP